MLTLRCIFFCFCFVFVLFSVFSTPSSYCRCPAVRTAPSLSLSCLRSTIGSLSKRPSSPLPTTVLIVVIYLITYATTTEVIRVSRHDGGIFLDVRVVFCFVFSIFFFHRVGCACVRRYKADIHPCKPLRGNAFEAPLIATETMVGKFGDINH